MEQINVTAQLRDKAGARGALSKLRTDGWTPAVIYGLGKPPVSVSVSEKEMLGVMKRGANAVLKLKYSDKEDNVIIKNVQYHVVTDRLIHVDFHRISLTEKVTVKVHIKIVGEAFGVKTQGGLLEHALRDFTVRCLPTDIPKEIEVDVKDLKLDSAIRVSDIRHADLEILDDPSHVVVSITAPKEEAVETPAAAAGAAAGAAAAEPEVVAGKGKKDEEGAAKPAAGAAAAKPGEKKAEPKK
ncbi:MAG TPA: 50S ribosomal protein L25 [Elusimicrobiales bacterium]|nr:50S ribosomal protein L25 [Elusimicrobiales bacterium]